jgi:hypothetical protein
MTKKLLQLLAVFSLLSLSSCDNAPDTGVSGTHDYAGKEFPITVIVYDTPAQLNKVANEKGITESADGFALWAIKKNDPTTMTKCTVHVVKPSSVRDYEQMTTWGHELVHCVYGTFHKEGER